MTTRLILATFAALSLPEVSAGSGTALSQISANVQDGSSACYEYCCCVRSCCESDSNDANTRMPLTQPEKEAKKATLLAQYGSDSDESDSDESGTATSDAVSSRSSNAQGNNSDDAGVKPDSKTLCCRMSKSTCRATVGVMLVSAVSAIFLVPGAREGVSKEFEKLRVFFFGAKKPAEADSGKNAKSSLAAAGLFAGNWGSAGRSQKDLGGAPGPREQAEPKSPSGKKNGNRALRSGKSTGTRAATPQSSGDAPTMWKTLTQNVPSVKELVVDTAKVVVNDPMALAADHMTMCGAAGLAAPVAYKGKDKVAEKVEEVKQYLGISRTQDKEAASATASSSETDTISEDASAVPPPASDQNGAVPKRRFSVVVPQNARTAAPAAAAALEPSARSRDSKRRPESSEEKEGEEDSQATVEDTDSEATVDETPDENDLVPSSGSGDDDESSLSTTSGSSSRDDNAEATPTAAADENAELRAEIERLRALVILRKVSLKLAEGAERKSSLRKVSLKLPNRELLEKLATQTSARKGSPHGSRSKSFSAGDSRRAKSFSAGDSRFFVATPNLDSASEEPLESPMKRRKSRPVVEIDATEGVDAVEPKNSSPDNAVLANALALALPQPNAGDAQNDEVSSPSDNATAEPAVQGDASSSAKPSVTADDSKVAWGREFASIDFDDWYASAFQQALPSPAAPASPRRKPRRGDALVEKASGTGAVNVSETFPELDTGLLQEHAGAIVEHQSKDTRDILRDLALVQRDQIRDAEPTGRDLEDIESAEYFLDFADGKIGVDHDEVVSEEQISTELATDMYAQAMLERERLKALEQELKTREAELAKNESRMRIAKKFVAKAKQVV